MDWHRPAFILFFTGVFTAAAESPLPLSREEMERSLRQLRTIGEELKGKTVPVPPECRAWTERFLKLDVTRATKSDKDAYRHKEKIARAFDAAKPPRACDHLGGLYVPADTARRNCRLLFGVSYPVPTAARVCAQWLRLAQYRIAYARSQESLRSGNTQVLSSVFYGAFEHYATSGMLVADRVEPIVAEIARRLPKSALVWRSLLTIRVNRPKRERVLAAWGEKTKATLEKVRSLDPTAPEIAYAELTRALDRDGVPGMERVAKEMLSRNPQSEWALCAMIYADASRKDDGAASAKLVPLLFRRPDSTCAKTLESHVKVLRLLRERPPPYVGDFGPPSWVDLSRPAPPSGAEPLLARK